jgi:hypothetical protein
LSAISLNLALFLERYGSLIWTDALKAVPKFVGHDVMYPKCSSWANLATFSISEAAMDNLEKTYFISDPNCIDIILS